MLKENVDVALDLISDILINPTFDEDELEREREVILQEIGQTRDTPDDLIFDHLQEACYPDQPMGWPIFGSEKTVSAFSRDDLKSYMSANYRAGGMMLIAAGAVEHAQLVDAAGSLFQRLALGDGPERGARALRRAAKSATSRISNRRIWRSPFPASPAPIPMR